MKQVRGKDTVVDSTMKEVKRHGTEGMPFAVYLNDFSNFQTDGICWHWHDELQITLITEGEFVCQAGSEKYVMGPGEVVFFNSCGLHQISPVKPAHGTLYSFLWKAELLGGDTESDLYRNCIAPIVQSHMKSAFFPLEHPLNRKMRSDLQHIISFMREKPRFYELSVYRRLSSVWLRICQQTDNGEAREDTPRWIAAERDEEKVKAAMAYIQKNYSEKITLESIAKAAMTNRSELCKCFRRVLDVTPNEFLTRYRLDRALELLENPRLHISDIAEATGFCSPSHFGSHFMKYMGCTPLQYRKNFTQ